MQKSLIPITSRIEEIVETVPGWTPVDQLFALFILACSANNHRGDIVEIGSWCGRSTAVLGLAARLTGRTRVHCVDLFPSRQDWQENANGDYSCSVTIAGTVYTFCAEHPVFKQTFEEQIEPIYRSCDSVRDIFNETIDRYDLNDIVTIHQGDSESFVGIAPEGFACKLVFLDGDHSYASVSRDIANIEPFVINGGWICFDDAFTSYGGVDRAIEDRILNNSEYEMFQQLTRKLFVACKKYENAV